MALRVSSVTETDSSSSSNSTSKEHSQSESQSKSESTTKKLLDSELMDQILGGLMKNMTDEEINQFAENLLRPQLNAALEESQQNYETTRLAKEQEIENLAANLTRSIDEQNSAYRKSTANVETAALSRGMGRSSYTMQTLANQGDALAKVVRDLTDENTRQSGQIQDQITQAARQNSQTQGRLNTDFASQLASKVQEMKENQRKEWNSNYLTAISAAMGQQTTGSQQTSGTTDTTGESHSDSTSHSSSTTYTNGRSSGSSKAKTPTTEKASTREIYGRYSPKNTSKIR